MQTFKVMMCSTVFAGTALLFVPAAKAEVTDADKTFLAMAAQSDQNEIALSKLAETKATNPQVKSFARKMVTDHMKLTASMKPYAMKWGLTPPTGPDADHQAELDKLNGLSGADFDKEYMSAMDMDHHKALDAFNQELSSTTAVPFKSAVAKGKTVVAGHTTMADSLQSKMS